MNSNNFFKGYPPDITPGRIVAVIDDQLVPGVQFCQDTKSGNRFVILWAPETDRLFKWEARSQLWRPIKPDTVSAAKKQKLLEIFQPR
jgi:hypothetical protein